MPTHFVCSIRFAVVAWAICTLLASPRPALAQPDAPADVAEAKLKEARAAFRSGEIEIALTAIDEALAAKPRFSAALLLKGQIHLEARAYAAAIEAYEAFLDSKPRGANKRKAQKIVRNLKVIRTTTISVETEQGPAEVFIDTKSLSRVCVAEPSCTVGFVPGKYTVIVSRDGFEDAREAIVLKARKAVVVKAVLIEKPSLLSVEVTPPDAALTIDGAPLTPENSTLSPGEHVVEAALDGYGKERQTITAALGKPIAVEFTLAERVRVEVLPEDVSLSLDGNAIAIEDGTITLPRTAGPFKLTATKDGYDPVEIEIPRTGDRRTPISMTLKPTPVPVVPKPLPVQKREWTPLQLGLLGAAGVVAAGGFVGSGIFGLRASSRKNDADELCGRDEFGLACSTPEGFETARSARTEASRSNIFFGIGSVGVVAGLAAFNMNDNESWSTRRKVSIGVTSAVTVVAFSIGSAYGLGARSSWNDSQQSCDGPACDRPGFIDATEARDKATVANTAFAVGAMATAATAYLFFSAEREGQPSLVPAASPEGAGLSLAGQF